MIDITDRDRLPYRSMKMSDASGRGHMPLHGPKRRDDRDTAKRYSPNRGQPHQQPGTLAPNGILGDQSFEVPLYRPILQ